MVDESGKVPGKRQLRRTERTEELIRCALDLVARDGVAGLTMTGLAQAAGGAVGAIYRYFDGKDALLAALQVRAIEVLQDMLRHSLKRPAACVEARGFAPAIQPIVCSLATWPAFAAEHPELYALVDGPLSDPTPILARSEAQAVRDALSPVLSHIESLFDDAVEQGALRPGDNALRTRVVWAAMHGVQHFQKQDWMEPSSRHAAAIRRELTQALLRGWATPSSVSGA